MREESKSERKRERECVSDERGLKHDEERERDICE